jgi:hypothetical protein
MLNPPRPKLSWKDIAEYSFLGEFDLLRHSSTDVRELDWTKPAYREATTKYFKLLRAKEEVSRLNVEIRRLRTFIHDEKTEMKKVIEGLRLSNPLLASELQRQWRSRSAINAFHIFRLDQIEAIPGFSGTRGIGTHLHVGSDLDVHVGSDLDVHVGDLDVHGIITSEFAAADNIQQEEHIEQMESMTRYLDSIVD